MRKVIARFWDRATKQRLVADGLFHQWGSGYEEFSAGPGNYTMAIIELPGGQIVTAMPEDVKFKEEP